MYIFASAFEEGAYRAYVTDEKTNMDQKDKLQIHLCRIFEDRFVFEEGAYRAYVTDEKTNMDQKDK